MYYTQYHRRCYGGVKSIIRSASKRANILLLGFSTNYAPTSLFSFRTLEKFLCFMDDILQWRTVSYPKCQRSLRASADTELLGHQYRPDSDPHRAGSNSSFTWALSSSSPIQLDGCRRGGGLGRMAGWGKFSITKVISPAITW